LKILGGLPLQALQPQSPLPAGERGKGGLGLPGSGGWGGGGGTWVAGEGEMKLGIVGNKFGRIFHSSRQRP